MDLSGTDTVPVDTVSVPESGTLVLNAVPEDAVSVFVDGDRRDVGRVDLSAGTHTIKCSHPRYGETDEKIFDVTAGQTDTLTCYFQSRVSVGTTWAEQGTTPAPWASILIDGENKDGMTTPRTFLLAPGAYQIAVEREGYEVVTSQQTLTVTPTFEERTYPIVFQIRKR